ncbi:MAG TPA: FecR family protein [Alphaproteobacteria bacterium]|nr:FecR family protein [Alphaproteobacteria bacterium]
MNLTRRAALAWSAILLGSPQAALGQERDCIAARVVGDATIQRGTATQPVRPAMPLRQGDRLVTGAGGRVEMRCPDGSSLVVGERSSVHLSIFITDDRRHNAVVEVLEGIVRALLPGGHAWERFDIVTRTAVASVRSTVWIVDVKPDSTGVFVESGGVLVSSRVNQAQVFLQPGYGVDVGTQAAPLEARLWGQARINDALARTRLP